MREIEIQARLDDLRSACMAAAERGRHRIVARMNSGGLLRSGMYFLAVRDKFLECEQNALREMASFATKVLSAKEAASKIDSQSLILHDDLRQLLERTLAAEGGGARAPDNAAAKIRQSFSQESERFRSTLVENIKYGLDSHTTSDRGFWNFLRRNAVVLVPIAGLIVAVLALLKK